MASVIACERESDVASGVFVSRVRIEEDTVNASMHRALAAGAWRTHSRPLPCWLIQL